MKKMLFPVLALGFALVACNESDVKSETAAPAAQPAVAQAPAPAAKPAEDAQAPRINTIDWEKAEEMAKNGAVFLDVRYPEELMKGYVLNAKNIPVNELKSRLSELPKDRDILVYCRSGRRSEVATFFLKKNGFDRVFNVAGGYMAYSEMRNQKSAK